MSEMFKGPGFITTDKNLALEASKNMNAAKRFMSDKLRKRFDTRVLGFAHGASFQPMKPELVIDKDYENGYIEGQRERRRYQQSYATAYGIKLSVITIAS